MTVITAAAIMPYTPSEDLVSVEGGGTYVNVIGPTCADCLLEVSPAGLIVKNLGAIGPAVWGPGASSGKVYAFAGNGDTYEVSVGATSVTARALVSNPFRPTRWAPSRVQSPRPASAFARSKTASKSRWQVPGSPA